MTYIVVTNGKLLQCLKDDKVHINIHYIMLLFPKGLSSGVLISSVTNKSETKPA